jgi:hypothetical protein
VVALAVANFNYVNAHQATPEVLTIAVLLGLLLALGAARRHPDKPRLWLLSALAAALFLSRYFALFFMLPLLALELFWLARPGRARRVLGVCGIALLPVVVWMGVAFTQTGHLTGSDRFAPRNLREEIQDWGELTTLPANLALFARTHTVDFLSTSAYASHSVVDRPYEMAPHELALLALSALCAGLLLQDGWRRLAAGGRTPQQRLGALRASPLYLPLAALASYHAMLIGLWSVGNNDPLYTRFLYPSYPLLLLVAFGAYARLRATRPWPLRLPFQLLYVSLIGVHLWRDHQALALPLR